MAERAFLRIIYATCSIPLILVAIICYLTNWGRVRTHFHQCVEQSKCSESLSDELIVCLQVAEDRRCELHFGVDYLGVIRAIFESLKGNIQGASTIEQQFVRTVIRKYERTFKRKFIEQLVAHLLIFRVNKRCVSESYLKIAHLGYSIQGVNSLLNLQSNEEADIKLFCEITAQLKYPQPRIKTEAWKRKHQQRSKWIFERYNLKKSSPQQ
ncbi:transglycosylase domain-containing protein [uncultured Shewanella sp.]|uniref:transglycosylase domain-containing protein n=1 Tax=uncultured Shewanella sp. TaxID=173975 RepID=UPI00261AEE6A|nr:transglycosylase domain-containing protein [uncultured Shewanella sp.]